MSIADRGPAVADAGAGGRNADSQRAATLRVLAVIDGSECTGRVVKYVLRLYAAGGPIEVVLLNIQPEPQDWRLRGYGWFQREAIHDRLVNDLGARVLTSAARHLDPAEIPHKDRIELGKVAETVLRCAKEENCDLIILAVPRTDPVRRWLARRARMLLGSIAQVVHLAPVPVVLVPYAW
jgi:nucleotide-binding universal stress UspA family protein